MLELPKPLFGNLQQFESVRKALSNNQADIRSSSISMIPVNTVELDVKTAKPALRLLEQLEDLDDVQRVYSNGDFPQEVIEQYGK